jgi:CheY-like chemotaxis protein
MAGRLLLVGELNDDLTELRISFEALGLTAEMAPDGLAALEKGREFQPDLVVTEILTSRLSGFELASRIGSGAAGFAAPVIFYTEFYRDEKARREVLAKYGAIQYFVRPFQKEALKKSVVAHFQDFLSGLPAVTIAESPPEPISAPEVNTPTPQLSRAAAATEKQPTNSVSGRPVQPGKPGGLSGEVPNRFRAFSPAAQSPSSEVVAPEPEAAGAIADEAENQRAEIPTLMPGPRAETGPALTRTSNPPERSFLLPVEEPSWFGRLLQLTPVRIAAVVIGAALAFYLVRGRFQGGSNEVPTQSQTPVSTQAPSPTQSVAERPTPQLAPPAASGVPSAQDTTVADVAKTGTDLAEAPVSSAADLSTKTHSVKKPETVDSRATARQRSAALSIQDVTGSGRGPVLRKMKPIQLSQEMLSSFAAKSVVVRVVIDREGKVTEVAPLNQEGAAVSLPPDALATIHQWKFSRSRRKDAGEAVKYFSLKVQDPRQ